METIELDLDNENEMTFKVQIEGTRPGEPICRLMIEGKDINHAIVGQFLGDDEVSILIPPMDKIIKEGDYSSYLEVFIDDRVFIPLEMQLNFEKSVKVVAETVKRTTKKKVSASASLLSTNKRKSRPIREKVVQEKIEKPAPMPGKKETDSRKPVNTITEQDILSLVNKLRNKVN